jgi:hypothetical protein
VTAGHVASKRQAMMSRMPLNVGVQRCFMWKLMETRTCNRCHAASWMSYEWVEDLRLRWTPVGGDRLGFL